MVHSTGNGIGAAMNSISNGNPSAFHTFMKGYWNQMADEIYNGFGEALSDFRATEGDEPYERLIAEIIALRAVGRFQPLKDIRAAYGAPFWKSYDRIIVQEDLDILDANPPAS
jgi:hypothetical protein